jgi:hypothetical protein
MAQTKNGGGNDRGNTITARMSWQFIQKKKGFELRFYQFVPQVAMFLDEGERE